MHVIFGGNVHHQMIRGETVSEKFKMFQQRGGFSTKAFELLEKLEMGSLN